MLGRFIQADTIVPEPGDPQSLNRYSYVVNSPLNFTDPSGNMQYSEGGYCSPGTCWYGPPEPRDAYQYVVQPHQQASYSAFVSSVNSLQSAFSFFTGTGAERQVFGPNSDLTQDVRFDPQMDRVRAQWADEGYPVPWKTETSIDERAGSFQLGSFLRAMTVYLAENAELVLALQGYGSSDARGRVDPVGGVLASFDEIRISDAGDGRIRVDVLNIMSIGSVLRIPSTNIPLLPILDRNRPGPFGNVYMEFFWYEDMP